MSGYEFRFEVRDDKGYKKDEKSDVLARFKFGQHADQFVGQDDDWFVWDRKQEERID